MPYDQNQLWKPTKPYILGSGKYAGKALEYVLLQDLPAFLTMKYQLESNIKEDCKPNEYHRHLMWLVDGINLLASRVKCSECDQNALYIPARGNMAEGYYYLAYPLCKKCVDSNYEWTRSTIFSITPWHFYTNIKKSEQKRIWKVIKIILKIDHMTSQQLFQLLLSNYGPI